LNKPKVVKNEGLERLYPWSLAGVIAGFALLLFWPVTSFDFVNFDDDLYVSKNIEVQRGLALDSVRCAFVDRIAGNWHPLTMLFHRLDIQFFGLDAGAHHRTNVILHAINAVLLFWLLRRATGMLWPSFAVALLFLAHPLRVESVAWIAQRKELLSTFFWLSGTIAYISFTNKRTWQLFSAIFILYACGLMSKPMAVTFPFTLFLLDYWPLKRFVLKEPKANGLSLCEEMAHSIKEKIPLFLLTVVFCAITFFAQREGGAVRDLEAISLGVRIQTAFVATVAYIGRTIFPWGQSALFNHPGSWSLWQWGFSAILVWGISVAVLAVRKSRPWLLFGWLWFLGTLVPVIGIVQVGNQWMADRYTYIPSIGLLVAICFEVASWAKKKRLATIIATAVCGFTVLALALGTRSWLGMWKNSWTLSAKSLRAGGQTWVMRTNLAISKAQAGDFAGALEDFRKLAAEYPFSGESQNNYGFALIQSGRNSDAAAVLERAVALDPKHMGARVNYATALLAEAKVPEGIKMLESVVEGDPNDPAAYFRLATIYCGAAGPAFVDPQKAVATAEKSALLNPRKTGQLCHLLGTAYSIDGRRADSEKCWREGLELARKESNSPLIRALEQSIAGASSSPR